MTRPSPHLPAPDLYGQKSRRRRILILGIILFGLYYGALLLPLFR